MENQDQKWMGLLRRSSATFAGESTVPYGFMTSMMARLNSEKRQQEEVERIGWRALLASLAALVIAGAVSLTFTPDRSTDFDPGVRSLVAVDNVPIS